MGAKASSFRDEYWENRGGGRLLIYIGPPLKEGLELCAVREFVCEKRAFGATWGYDWDCGDQGPWHRYVCDVAGYDIDKIESKRTRNHIRRCLKLCVVRKIDIDWLARNGYETYIKATRRYKKYVALSNKKFKEDMLALAEKSGYQVWGVFRNGVLIAYGILRVTGELVQFLVSKFDPDYAKSYPMYGLYYAIGQHYLKEKGYKQILGATKALLHETNVGEFRLKMGWRKVHCRLGLYLVFRLWVILLLARALRKLLKYLLPARQYAILNGLLQLQDVAKATKAKRTDEKTS